MNSNRLRILFTSFLMLSFSISSTAASVATCAENYQSLTGQAETARKAAGVGIGVGSAGTVAAGAVVAGNVTGYVLLSLTGWGLVVVGVAIVGGFAFSRYQANQEIALSRQIDVLKIYQQAKLYLAENPMMSAQSPRLPLDLAVFTGTLNPSQNVQVTQRILEEIVAAMDQGLLCSSKERLFNSLDLHTLIQSRLFQQPPPRTWIQRLN